MLTLWNLVSRLRVYYWQMIFVKFIELFVFYKPDLGRYSAFLINQKMLSPLHHIQPTYNLEPNIYNLNHSINSHNLLTRLENTKFSNYNQREVSLHKKTKKKVVPVAPSTPIMSFVTYDCLQFIAWVTDSLINKVLIVKMKYNLQTKKKRERGNQKKR